MNDIRTESVEDFVKAVYKLQQLHDQVPTTAIAQELNITPPSATDMAKKLSDDSRLKEPLITYTRYKGVRLTKLGEEVALEVLRHHRLIELYLVEALGYSLDEVHEEAERLEHVISERFEARIAEWLGHPDIDPHGDPIPSLEGDMPEGVMLVSLAEFPIGKPGTVKRLLDQTPDILQYLHEKGISPGVTITVTERELFDGLTHIVIDGKEHVLGQTITRHLLLSPEV
ncbi:MAG: metal-dependent transcriptional regulator [Chloroflexi bacterium]|nr:metal-dependent transcriptional regulator [Chloroflexota bacterium]